jgi:hypothetical protein
MDFTCRSFRSSRSVPDHFIKSRSVPGSGPSGTDRGDRRKPRLGGDQGDRGDRLYTGDRDGSGRIGTDRRKPRATRSGVIEDSHEDFPQTAIEGMLEVTPANGDEQAAGDS